MFDPMLGGYVAHMLGFGAQSALRPRGPPQRRRNASCALPLIASTGATVHQRLGTSATLAVAARPDADALVVSRGPSKTCIEHELPTACADLAANFSALRAPDYASEATNQLFVCCSSGCSFARHCFGRQEEGCAETVALAAAQNDLPRARVRAVRSKGLWIRSRAYLLRARVRGAPRYRKQYSFTTSSSPLS